MAHLTLTALIGVSQLFDDDLMFQVMFLTEIPKALDPSVGRAFFRSWGIHVNKHIALVSGKEARGLYSTHIIVGVDAAYKAVLTFDCNDWNRQSGQFTGGNGVA